MIRCGLCLRSNHDPRHIYVVLNDPGQSGGILLVNFTTRQLPRDAKEEIFSPADYSLLSHQSGIAFLGTYPGATAGALDSVIRNGDFTPLPDVPGPTLERIIAAARNSRHLSITQKRLLA